MPRAAATHTHTSTSGADKVESYTALQESRLSVRCTYPSHSAERKSNKTSASSVREYQVGTYRRCPARRRCRVLPPPCAYPLNLVQVAPTQLVQQRIGSYMPPEDGELVHRRPRRTRESIRLHSPRMPRGVAATAEGTSLRPPLPPSPRARARCFCSTTRTRGSTPKRSSSRSASRLHLPRRSARRNSRSLARLRAPAFARKRGERPRQRRDWRAQHAARQYCSREARAVPSQARPIMCTTVATQR